MKRKETRRTIDDVDPELSSRVLETLDAALVELGEGEERLGVDVLIERAEYDDGERGEDEVVQQNERVLEEVLK